eukprot:gene1478-biopygen18325
MTLLTVHVVTHALESVEDTEVEALHLHQYEAETGLARGVRARQPRWRRPRSRRPVAGIRPGWAGGRSSDAKRRKQRAHAVARACARARLRAGAARGAEPSPRAPAHPLARTRPRARHPLFVPQDVAPQRQTLGAPACQAATLEPSRSPKSKLFTCTGAKQIRVCTLIACPPTAVAPAPVSPTGGRASSRLASFAGTALARGRNHRDAGAAARCGGEGVAEQQG